MKTKNIITAVFILLTLNLNSFANNNLNETESNTKGMTSVLSKHGRNIVFEKNQSNTDLQITTALKSKTIITSPVPKGRNVEVNNMFVSID